MPAPPIQVFLTTIASQPALRQRQDYLLRILHVKKIPFTSYDLASDENAKKLWKRKAPADKAQLPGILIGGLFPGTFNDFEDAVEFGELDTFLRRNEKYNEKIEEDRPLLASQPIGVPGAATPLQMTPERLRPVVEASSRPSGSPLTGKAAIPVNKRDDEFDVGEELSGFGLQGVKVSQDDLAALVEELGLGGDEAEELVNGLSNSGIPEKKGLKIENVDDDANSGQAKLANVLTSSRIAKKDLLKVEKEKEANDEMSTPEMKHPSVIKDVRPESSLKTEESTPEKKEGLAVADNVNTN